MKKNELLYFSSMSALHIRTIATRNDSIGNWPLRPLQRKHAKSDAIINIKW